MAVTHIWVLLFIRELNTNSSVDCLMNLNVYDNIA